MSRLESFSTAGLAARCRLEFWNDLACNTFTPIVADPLDLERFAPSLSRASVHDVVLSEVHSSPSVVRHTREHVSRTRAQMFFLHAQLDGRSGNRQAGREACLEAGDFTLFDSSRPYQMTFEEPNTVLVIGVPEHMLRRHLAHPESVVGLALRRGEPLTDLLCGFVRQLWRLCGRGDAPLAHSTVAALLHLIGGAYSHVPQASADAATLAEVRRLRIVRYVEEHLGDSDLGPAKIAAAFCTTPRNLHMMFSRGGETLCRFIWRRRVEECARILADRSFQGRKISDVVYDLGFSSLTHFGKLFHGQFGMTASEYREQHRRAADTAA